MYSTKGRCWTGVNEDKSGEVMTGHTERTRASRVVDPSHTLATLAMLSYALDSRKGHVVFHMRCVTESLW